MEDTPDLDCGDWIDWFYSSFDVYLQTPFGLADHYKMLQGGAQGDSMGVGAYMLLRILRAKALRSSVSGPPHPGLPTVEVPEVIFADDARQFGRTAVELGETVSQAATIANECGVSVQTSKLKAYCNAHSSSSLVYVSSVEVPTVIGRLTTKSKGLGVVGIPCVIGDNVKDIVDAAMISAQTVLRSVRRHHPSCILTLRVMLAFVVSSLDYKLAIVPTSDVVVHPLQRLLQQIIRSALGVPNWFPSAFLTLPLRWGGLGVPVLHLRLLYHRLLHTVQASQCRSVLTRELIKSVLLDPCWNSLRAADPILLQQDLAARGFVLVLNPPSNMVPAQVTVVQHSTSCQSTGHHVVVSDGSCQWHSTGYAAVILNSSGVLTSARGCLIMGC